MARIEALVVGRVIGDVLDMFAPAAELVVLYDSKQIGNGCEIKPSFAADKPTVRITGSRDRPALFTLIMVDPDAPSPSEPTLREWLHWLVVNIPEGGDATQDTRFLNLNLYRYREISSMCVGVGKELVSYMGPQPPTGIHRYVFAVFQQGGVIERPKDLPGPRQNFSTRSFVKENNLGLPVSAVYFNAQKEPAGNKKR